MSDCLIIEGLRLAAHVGVTDEERAVAQEVLVRLEISAHLEAATASDNLDDTIDYAAVLLEAEQTVAGGSFALLEHMAGRIATAVSGFKGVEGVTVEIEKTVPPVPQRVGRVAVRIER
jgi:dihydroneopterin aldolase